MRGGVAKEDSVRGFDSVHLLQFLENSDLVRSDNTRDSACLSCRLLVRGTAAPCGRCVRGPVRSSADPACGRVGVLSILATLPVVGAVVPLVSLLALPFMPTGFTSAENSTLKGR